MAHAALAESCVTNGGEAQAAQKGGKGGEKCGENQDWQQGRLVSREHVSSFFRVEAAADGIRVLDWAAGAAAMLQR